MPEDLGERTEEPTPKRLREAREEGQVARSQDLASALLLIAASASVAAAAAWMLGHGKTLLAQVLDGGFVIDPLQPLDVSALGAYVGRAAAQLAAPVLFAAWLAGVLAHLWQVGILATPKAVRPRLEKLNPLSGFKRIFGISALVKVALDSMKVLVIVAVVVASIIQYHERIAVLPMLTALQAAAEVGTIMLILAIRVLFVLLLLGLLDYLYQRWKFTRDLRMTKQQVKDEMKETEGDPETKKRRARMAQQVAMQRIGAAVPKADVIVTNPEHISVAIQYDSNAMTAPKVVAKGADYLALRIRQIATNHGVPIVERKPLARALYKQVPVGAEIPPAFYQAVAEILAYVYRLSGRKAG